MPVAKSSVVGASRRRPQVANAVDDETGVERRIDGFLSRYTPAIEARLRDARGRLRGMFPRGVELVFDNYNALVFAISPSERSTDGFVSVAGYPKWVTLFFLHGAALDDPGGLLEGTGKQVRSIRLRSGVDVDTEAVAALVAQAARPHVAAFAAAPPLHTVVKTVATTLRPRRPAVGTPAP